MSVNDADRQVGFRLQAAREAGEWNQSELAARLTEAGLRWSQGTLSRVETGQRPVRLTEAVVLAEVLGVALSELIPGHSNLDTALRRISEKEDSALRALAFSANDFRAAHNLAQVLRLADSLQRDPDSQLAVDRSAPRTLWDATTWTPLDDLDVYGVLHFFGISRDSVQSMRSAAQEFVTDFRGDTSKAAEALERLSPADFRVALVGPGDREGHPGEGELRLRHLLLSAGDTLEERFPGLTFEVSSVPPGDLTRIPITVDGLPRIEFPAELSSIGGVLANAAPSA